MHDFNMYAWFCPQMSNWWTNAQYVAIIIIIIISVLFSSSINVLIFLFYLVDKWKLELGSVSAWEMTKVISKWLSS